MKRILTSDKTFLGDFSGSMRSSMSVTLNIKWENIKNHQGYYFVDANERLVAKLPKKIFVSDNADPYSPSAVSYTVKVEEIYPGFWIYEMDERHRELADEIGSPVELLLPSPHLGQFPWEKI